MAFKPETASEWVKTVTGAITALTTTIIGTYLALQSAGLIGGKLEAINAYLNEKNVGEHRVETMLSEDPKDIRIEYVYDSGDTLYFRQWTDSDGGKQKLKRWTSKTPVDVLYERATARNDWHIGGGVAHASVVPVFAGEVYVGQTEDGDYVYYIPDEDVCEVQDSTGDIIDMLPPPCEQYVIPSQKKG